MRAVSAETEAVNGNVVPNDKAEAPDDDQKHYDPADERVAVEVRQRRSAAVVAHNIETGVTEGGNGVENTAPDPLPDAEQGNKADRKEQRARSLEQKRPEEDLARDLHNAVHPGKVDALDHRFALTQSHPAIQRNEEQRGDRHEPETADLDQYEYHNLPEDRPARRGRLKDQPGDAGCRSRREKRGPESD